MLEALLSRFKGTVALIDAEMSSEFEGCVSAIAAHEHGAALMAEPMVAGTDGFWFPPDDWRASYRPYHVEAGVLQIPVRGVLLANFGFQMGSYATGYHYIWKAFERGLADESVERIAFMMHCPGGEARECFDTVDRMVAAREGNSKPVWAFAYDQCTSGAYALASVADEIAMSRTGGVGSVGVVTSHIDLSEAMEKSGVKVTFISAPEGGHKTEGGPYEKLSKTARDRIQARIDETYELFVSTITVNRGMSEEDVRGSKAAVFTPNQAVENGFADRVGTLDSAVAAFAALSVPETQDEDQIMSTQAQDTGKKPANGGDEAAVNAARAEGYESGKADGVKEGAQAERDRVSAIINSDEGKKRPKAALSAAIKTGMSTEDAISFLGDLAEETVSAPAQSEESVQDQPKGKDGAGKDFVSAMNQSDNPQVGAGNDAESGNNADQEFDAVLTYARGSGLLRGE